ncbi:eukaryotic translation initiation factor 4E [Cryptotrichosporon argae]
MAAAVLPPAAAAANAQTLTDAMAAASITETKDREEGEISEDEGEGGVKTVFDDASSFNVKHPLYAEWTLHFDSPQSKLLPKTPSAPGTPVAHGGWMDDIRKVVTFDSVEEFWGLYNNIVPPSQLPGKANYYLFKNGIMPAWEDPANKNGGKWGIQVPREKTKGTIDKMWLYTMLAAIGETFETPLPGAEEKATPPVVSDLVTGVIVSTRPGFYRIAIWTRDAPDVNAPETDPLMARILMIGRHFKVSVLGYELDQKLVTGGFQTEVTFESHKDSEKKGNKNKIVI